uniref:Uncharacterized protein n=1 Tax=Sparus aurata TaxID=8175 RepID=A0A671V6K5_SPAAU
MTKKDCPVGSHWDSLVNDCFISLLPSEPTLPIVVKLRSTERTAQVNPVMVLSPALWIFVVLATLGSILTLALWFVIYRRQNKDAEQQQEPPQKTEPAAIIHSQPSQRNGHAHMSQRGAAAPSPCYHPHLGAQTSSQWEGCLTSNGDPTKHAGTNGGRGLPTCSTVREHRIPLPATELGGTALVTTKTM